MNRFWLILAVLFGLSACNGERCIEADDFGFANLVISARYTKEELSGQFGVQQVAPWRDSTYKVNGRPLTILVHGWTQGSDKNNASELSAWCAWYGQSDNTKTLSRFCERLRECKFIDDEMCTNTKDAAITNAPCIFKRGVGLYALIAKKGTNPNLSLATQRNPQGLSFHLGEQTSGYEMLDIDKYGHTRQAGGLVYKYEDSSGATDDLKQQYANSPLYFKILDKFYDDNSGQYRIAIKSGVSDTNPDPVTYVTNLVKNFLFGADGDYGLIRNLYLGIINNPGYRVAVSAMLSLYIMWTALSYLAGNVQLTQTELIVRIMKIAIVSALLSSAYSWSFFNDYLFVWFVGGVEQILQMIMEAGSTGPGSPSILGMMLAPQTIAKLSSLLFADWMGFIYIILFLFALYFVILIFFDAAIIYMTALIAIGMIITLGPIFICFLLFGITRSLFENWLRQLISYAVQPIILFTGLIFISIILRQEIYGALGFRVCKQTFPKMDNGGGEIISDFTRDNLGFDLGNSLFYWWFPMPMRGEQFTRTTVNIPIPIDHYVSEGDMLGDGNSGQFCEAYGCIGPRYADLPFLDPAKDTRRINQFWNGKFVQLDGMLLIFVAIYLLHKFNGITISIAKFITATSGNYVNIRGVADGASSGIRGGIGKVAGRVRERAMQTEFGRKVSAITQKATAIATDLKIAPSRAIDALRIKRLKKEALSDNPIRSVEKEAIRISGINPRNLNLDAIEQYKTALQWKLQEIDSSLTQGQARKIAGKLSHKDFKELKNEFAKAKYSKDYAMLGAKEKADIERIVNGKVISKKALQENLKNKGKDMEELARSKYGKEYTKLSITQQEAVEKEVNRKNLGVGLHALQIEATAVRKYREAYIDAYQALSERGVGLIGKRIKSIRSLEELNYKASVHQELEQAKRQQTGEEIYAGYENLKHYIYKEITGGSKDQLGNTFAGGRYNEIDTSKAAKNYRMQTYNEMLADRARKIKYQEVTQKIDDLSKKQNTNVVSPEFIARRAKIQDPELLLYQALREQQISEQVYEELAKGEDPVLKGEKFMTEYATRSDISNMVNRAEQVKEQLIKEDEFIKHEAAYEYRTEIAREKVINKIEELEEHFKRPVTSDEVVSLTAEYGHRMGQVPEAIQAEVSKVSQALQGFEDNQRILQEIDQRKQDIINEVDKHIHNINQYGKKFADKQVNVSVGTHSSNYVSIRPLKKIEDYRKNK